MPAPEFVQVDPRTPHLPPSSFSGADPFKLHRQIAAHESSTAGMPLLIAYRGNDSGLVIADGDSSGASAPRLPGDRGGDRDLARRGRWLSNLRRSDPMIPPERRELLRLIEEMGEAYPEFRLGQLIANLAFWARGDQAGAVWSVQDAELTEAILEQIRNAKHRTQPVT